MIKVEKLEVYNFEGALRGLRNPKNSWDKSDSYYDKYHHYIIGEKDMHLCQMMVGAGTDESKFLRQIFVSFDITAPFYWWKEFDTYKVGTVADSCSTMHKLTAKPFDKSDFSFDYVLTEKIKDYAIDGTIYVENTLRILNRYRDLYIETKDKNYWYKIVQMLPSSYNQKRTITLNYQVLRAMYFARRNHKLDEWRNFCKFIETMPYAEELICYEKGE